MNSLTLVGRLTRDAGNSRTEKSIKLSVATNEGYDKKKGKPIVHFVDVYVNKVNEKLLPYLTKGREILIRNAVVSNREGNDGSYRTLVFLYGGNGNIQLLGSKPKAENPKAGSVA